MDKSKTHIRHCLLYEFESGHREKEAHQNINKWIGDGLISKSRVYTIFKRFKEGDYTLEDKQRPGRPVELNLEQLKTLITQDPRLTTRCLASILGCSHTTIQHHLGLVSKLDVYVPRDLTPTQLNQRADTCANLLSLHRTQFWMDDIITGDEKWVLYVNHSRKRSWVEKSQEPMQTPKDKIHHKKIMLSVWWNIRGIVYWDILPHNTNVNATVYCSQIENVKAKLDEVTPKIENVYFLHDNA